MAKLLLLLFFTGCKKDSPREEEAAFVSIINTVPGILNPLALYIDTSFTSQLPYPAGIRNIELKAGLAFISIRDSTRTKTLLKLPGQEFAANTSSTIIVYDTLHPVDTTVRAIRLSDDMTIAPNGVVKVRFVHAAPRTGAVDVTFVRTSVSPFDSLTFSAQSYIGASVNVQTLSAFTNMPLGAYTLKVKNRGTQDTIMQSQKISVSNLAGFAGITGITTFYLTGGVQGVPLGVGLFRHYP